MRAQIPLHSLFCMAAPTLLFCYCALLNCAMIVTQRKEGLAGGTTLSCKLVYLTIAYISFTWPCCVRTFVRTYICSQYPPPLCSRTWMVTLYMRTCVHVYQCTCVHVYQCTCVCVYVCTCVRVYPLHPLVHPCRAGVGWKYLLHWPEGLVAPTMKDVPWPCGCCLWWQCCAAVYQ